MRISDGSSDVCSSDLLRPRGDRVDRRSALDQADIDRRARLEIGECVQALDLAGQFLDRADAVLRPAAGMGGLAGDLELEEPSALADGHDIAARTARLRAEHSAGVPRLAVDYGQRVGGG